MRYFKDVTIDDSIEELLTKNNLIPKNQSLDSIKEEFWSILNRRTMEAPVTSIQESKG